MVGNLPDFLSEVTLLQYFCEKRSKIGGSTIKVIRSPKCHPELAGEGIEYCWAAAKNFFRRQKIEDRRSTEKFHALVKRALSSEVVHLEMCRSFSAKARQYMLAYQTVERLKNGDDPSDVKNMETSAHLLDKVVSERKSHRGVAHENKWVLEMMNDMRNQPTHAEFR